MRDNTGRQGEDNKIIAILSQEARVENSGCECTVDQPAEASVVQGKLLSIAAQEDER